MSDYCAVLMDTISIQKYIFASNKLQDNLGASQIIANLFEKTAAPVLAEVCGLEREETVRIIANWKEQPAIVLMEEESEVPFEVGVSGGGKALLYFRDKNTAERFIRRFTAELLVEAPGLQLAVAVMDKFDQKHFSSELSALYKKLTQNRNRHFPITEVPQQGLTAICPESGASLNLYSEVKGDYISCGKEMKLNTGKEEEKMRRDELTARYKEYDFSNQLDKLGQTEGDSYVAVVHIDGNNMGNWFQQSKSLTDYRQRSLKMASITEDSFWCLIEDVVGKMNKLKETKQFDLHNFLPIRPIILGGDDITFVCHGKLGLYLTEKYLQLWTEKANAETGMKPLGVPENGDFSACAGIAFTKTKYPFYRSYQFAEQCCKAAKKIARKENGSWIDFQIITGTKSGNLDKIREEEGKVSGLKLYFGPYCLNPVHQKSLHGLKSGIYMFHNDKYWAHNNLKELRSAFSLGQEVVDIFLTDMKAKGGQLPYFEKYGRPDYQSRGYSGDQSPYPDIIEMMEFYPYFLLEGRRIEC